MEAVYFCQRADLLGGGGDGVRACLRKVRVCEPTWVALRGLEVRGDEQNGGWRSLLRSSHGADGFQEGDNGWAVLGGDLTFFDQVVENEFEGAEVVALVDGDEEATEGDFDEFQKRNGNESGIGSDNEEA